MEMTGHIILCGSSDSFLPFIHQLRKTTIETIPVVILTEEEKDKPGIEEALKEEQVYYVFGNSTNKVTLVAAGVKNAK